MLAGRRARLKDLLGQDPDRRLLGMRNAIVFGRAVTNVLEHLRGKVEGFDSWYKPQSARLGQDESFRRIYKMRSEILKEGATNVGTSMHIKSSAPATCIVSAPGLRVPPGSSWEISAAELAG